MRAVPLASGDESICSPNWKSSPILKRLARRRWPDTMTPYIDVGFLSALLIKTPGRKIAWHNLHKFNPPYSLNLLHHLQIENLLVRCQLDPDDAIKTTG